MQLLLTDEEEAASAASRASPEAVSGVDRLMGTA
jgi:hypothetical protein